MIETGSQFLGRSCADCIAFMWSDKGVEGINIAANTRKKYRSVWACRLAGAEPTKRPRGVITPCHNCPKVRDDAPRPSYYYADEVTERTWLTIQHFEECDAVSLFPDDPIVKRNAATIRKTRAECARAEQQTNMAHMLSVLSLGKG